MMPHAGETGPQPPKNGHNNPPPDPLDELIDDIEQDEQVAALIIAYVAAEMIDGAMGLDDVKPLDGGQRLLHNRNGLFLATMRYCRQGDRPDMTLALLNTVHGLADNKRGGCFISFGRLARLLGTTARTLRRARERAERLGLLMVITQEDEDGGDDTNLLWLAVMPKLAKVRPVEVVRALTKPSRPGGRPKGAKAGDASDAETLGRQEPTEQTDTETLGRQEQP
jgi:hypothetical protein